MTLTQMIADVKNMKAIIVMVTEAEIKIITILIDLSLPQTTSNDQRSCLMLYISIMSKIISKIFLIYFNRKKRIVKVK